jgi:hypothetical protein
VSSYQVVCHVFNIFKDWDLVITFDELVINIDAWRDVVFKWIENMVSAMGPSTYLLLTHYGSGYAQGMQGFLAQRGLYTMGHQCILSWQHLSLTKLKSCGTQVQVNSHWYTTQ